MKEIDKSNLKPLSILCLKFFCSYQHSNFKYFNKTVEVNKYEEAFSTIPVFF